MNYFALLAAAALIGIDQLIKFWVDANLKSIYTMPFINIGGTEIINLTYCENTGAAFSIFADKTIILSIITGAFLLVLLYLLLFKKLTKPPLVWSIALIFAGGIGNLIDRIFRGYVIDYLQVKLFDFAIFNFADCCVVIGAIMFFVYLVFFDKPKKVEA